MTKPSRSGSRKRGASAGTCSAATHQADQMFACNQMIERSSLDSFSIRYPGLLVHAYFYYKFVESGECAVSAHGHRHWEISRVQSGEAGYFIQGYGELIVSDPEHYLIIPPKVVHGWQTSATPLQMNSWQLTIEAEDHAGDLVLDMLERTVETSGFMVKASAEQIQAEELLWKMAGNRWSWQLFGPVLYGFACIVIGDLLATLNPWPEGSLDTPVSAHAAAQKLARRLKMFLDENLSLPITIKELEAHFHYSGRHLNRTFREVYNSSIGHYMRVQRIDLAKRWLGTTDRSVKDIALSLGYSDSSQFCRYFLKQIGLTPSQFRSGTSANQYQPSRNLVLSPGSTQEEEAL